VDGAMLVSAAITRAGAATDAISSVASSERSSVLRVAYDFRFMGVPDRWMEFYWSVY
jgi:hypothetical protein